MVLRRTAASEARQRQRTLPKYFDWKEAEGRLYGWWESEGCFRPIDGRSGAEEGKFVMAMISSIVTNMAWPICSAPVTLGGGMAITNFPSSAPDLPLSLIHI